ncbi:MAG: HAD family hydrolase [Pyrinomonadaceae bacterium]
MIKAVIFDIDGTLVDTVDMHAEAWQRAFREFGKEIEFQAIRDQIGKGGDQLLPVFLNEDEMDEIGKQVEERRGEIYKAEYMPHARPFPAVRELFERIHADGRQIALASSAPEDELKFYKQITRIDDLIHGETSADDAERSKPHPDIFAAALEQLEGVDPAECLAVGDTPYDAIAAGKLGIRTVGVLCGGFPVEWLRDAGCIAIYQDPSELLAEYEQFMAGEEGENARLAADPT